MKFTILENGKQEQEQEIKLSMYTDSDGSVMLEGVDLNGDYWQIMQFKNGRFRRTEFIRPGSGIEVDGRGRIIEEE